MEPEAGSPERERERERGKGGDEGRGRREKAAWAGTGGDLGWRRLRYSGGGEEGERKGPRGGAQRRGGMLARPSDPRSQQRAA